jgi:hypothetical protein
MKVMMGKMTPMKKATLRRRKSFCRKRNKRHPEGNSLKSSWENLILTSLLHLVDRGANGGLAGKDLKVIATTDRRVDITGINDIRVDNIRIGTVGGVVKSHRGPVIAIFHQYALGYHGNSIHSSGQMESYRNKIDDRSIKVGGTQSITTIDGYVLPLDVVNGLPHLKSRPFSDREWKEYPHVVMTSDNEWNPKVLENIISTKPNSYSSVKPPEHDVLTNPFDITGEYTKSQLEDPLVYSHLDISWVYVQHNSGTCMKKTYLLKRMRSGYHRS